MLSPAWSRSCWRLRWCQHGTWYNLQLLLRCLAIAGTQAISLDQLLTPRKSGNPPSTLLSQNNTPVRTILAAATSTPTSTSTYRKDDPSNPYTHKTVERAPPTLPHKTYHSFLDGLTMLSGAVKSTRHTAHAQKGKVSPLPAATDEQTHPQQPPPPVSYIQSLFNSPPCSFRTRFVTQPQREAKVRQQQ